MKRARRMRPLVTMLMLAAGLPVAVASLHPAVHRVTVAAPPSRARTPLMIIAPRKSAHLDDDLTEEEKVPVVNVGRTSAGATITDSPLWHTRYTTRESITWPSPVSISESLPPELLQWSPLWQKLRKDLVVAAALVVSGLLASEVLLLLRGLPLVSPLRLANYYSALAVARGAATVRVSAAFLQGPLPVLASAVTSLRTTPLLFAGELLGSATVVASAVAAGRLAVAFALRSAAAVMLWTVRAYVTIAPPLVEALMRPYRRWQAEQEEKRLAALTAAERARIEAEAEAERIRLEREKLEQVAEGAMLFMLTGGVVGAVAKAAGALATIGFASAGAVVLDDITSNAEKEVLDEAAKQAAEM